MIKRRVVVTGIGMVTPLGLNLQETWQSIKLGKSGIGHVDCFDISAFSVRIGGLLKNFDATPYMSIKDVRKNDLFVQYGIAAAQQAVEDSGMIFDETKAHRYGVAIGAGIGGIPMIERNYHAFMQDGPRKIAPSFIPGAIINTTAGQVTLRYGLQGPSIAIVTACTTGTHNIGYAARTIAYGDADVMITGGSEMATCPLGIGGFASMRALSTRNDEPEKASRPWDRERDGFVLGEGAGMLVLESYEHAKARDAHIYAELVGFGASSDAFHMTLPQPEGRGGAQSMLNALNDAGMNADEIDYINAHATSTPAGDELEILGIKKALGEHSKKVMISSTKSMTGHLLGAAGAVEAIISIKALDDQIVPPTINLDAPSDGCDLDLVPHTARDAKLTVCLSNSFGFGGTNGTLIFKKMS